MSIVIIIKNLSDFEVVSKYRKGLSRLTSKVNPLKA